MGQPSAVSRQPSAVSRWLLVAAELWRCSPEGPGAGKLG
jgi:hypothetical protein